MKKNLKIMIAFSLIGLLGCNQEIKQTNNKTHYLSFESKLSKLSSVKKVFFNRYQKNTNFSILLQSDTFDVNVSLFQMVEKKEKGIWSFIIPYHYSNVSDLAKYDFELFLSPSESEFDTLRYSNIVITCEDVYEGTFCAIDSLKYNGVIKKNDFTATAFGIW